MPRVSSSTKKSTAVKVKPPSKKSAATVFTYEAAQANQVSVAGSFNEWNPGTVIAKKDKKGKWTAKVTLAPGTYEYKFVVDGSWVIDPANSRTVYNSVGSQNSVIEVK